MPLYDYRCPKSGEMKEVRHGMNENPKVLSKVGCEMKRITTSVNLAGFDQYGRS